MTDESVASLDIFVARELDRCADAITETWLQELSVLLRVPATRLLPTDDIRDHVPDLVRSIAMFTGQPLGQGRGDIVELLRTHTELRRSQGYEMQQVFTEFEVLSRVVFRTISASLRNYPSRVEAWEVADLVSRIREVLSDITSEAVGMYRIQEIEHERTISSKLAEFARAIVHELKNPLGAAQAGAKMLQEPGVVGESAERDRFTALVLRNLVRMHDLIDDVRALALAEDTGGLERWMPVPAIVRRVVDELDESAANRGVRVEVHGGLPDHSVDATRLTIALINLVSNGIKYADPAKQDRWVRIAAIGPDHEEEVPGGWAISVADNGLGIPKDVQGQVFRRNFRAHPSAAEGTGLGLAIAHEIITRRGGKLWFTSEPGRGTTFYVAVPREVDAAGTAAETAGAAPRANIE